MLKETKRTLALVLALIMMFGTFSGSLGTAAYADEPETEEEQVRIEYPEFRQSAFIDWEFESEAAKRAEQGEDFVNEGLHLALSAPEGVFPEGSELKVALRDYADVNLSVSKVREAGYNVRQKYCFQVGVYGADGETYISPDTKNNTVPVTVTIGIDELPDEAGYSKVSLYRTSYADKRTDVLFSGKELEGNTITAEAYGLGYWTLEFEYLLTYRLKTDEEVLLKDICDYHHLSGTPSEVISKAPGLFTVTQNEDGEYVVKALSAFGGAELELWYDGVKYSVMLDAVPGDGAAEEEEAEETEETEEEEAEELEEGYHITFTATEGGKVAYVPQNGEEAVLEESIDQTIAEIADLKDIEAVADEGYVFKGWMYKGEKFHEGDTFTWANVPMLEDSQFVAAFEEKTVEFEEKSESGITVKVVAPATALPEGTVMKVFDVEEERVIDAVTDAVSGKINKVQAADISFWVGEEEVEPAKPVQVKIISSFIREVAEPQLIYVPDSEADENDVIKVDTDPVSENSDEMTFTADRFSVYVIVEIVATIDEYRITAHTADSSLQIIETGLPSLYDYTRHLETSTGNAIDFTAAGAEDSNVPLIEGFEYKGAKYASETVTVPVTIEGLVVDEETSNWQYRLENGDLVYVDEEADIYFIFER